jgi:DNA-binding response OmpR family regulator
VFVVEDDPDISQIVVAALQDEGYEVNRAQNGLDALAALRAQADDPPGVIILERRTG